MPTLRLALVATTIGAATIALPASAHVDSRQALAGVTTVVAQRSGSARLVLTKDATLTLNQLESPDAAISGSGRFVGLWLSGYQVDKNRKEWSYLGVFRLPAFAGGRTVTFGAPLGPRPHTILLRQGQYRLTVVTDGAPVRFTLHLHGVGGDSVISPTRAFRTVEAPLPQRDGVGSTTITWGRAEPHFTSSTTLLEFVDATVPKNADAWGSAECVRYVDGSPEPPMAYGSLCPGGWAGGGYELRAGPREVGGEWVGGGLVPGPTSGELGLGGSAWSDRGLTFHSALGVWIAHRCTCWAWQP